MNTVYLSIGSNIGNPYENCRQAIRHLDAHPDITVLKVSKFYRTEPVDFKDQDWFLNGALKIETTLDPMSTLKALKTIENTMGQFKKAVRFGPRIIDLDLIFFNDEILNTGKLILPHPRMHKRCFVLKPLCDIDSQIMHPVYHKTVTAMFNEIKNDENQAVLAFNEGGNT